MSARDAAWARIDAEAIERAKPSVREWLAENPRKGAKALAAAIDRFVRFERETLTFQYHVRGFPDDFLMR